MPAIARLWHEAERHASRCDWPRARAAYLGVLQRAPEHAAALLQLSYIESLTGHYRQARDYALQACRAQPEDADTVGELAARLRTFNEAELLFECVARFVHQGAAEIPLLIQFAAHLSNLNEPERALELMDLACDRAPDDASALLMRGQILTYLGRFDEAETDLERCIARAPDIAQAHWFLSRLRRQTAASNHVERLRRQLSKPARRPEDTALLQYALHKELDDLQDYSAAWQALEQACRAKRSLLTYSAEDSRDLVDKLIDWSSAAAPATDPALTDAHIPIFIVGMHRSGTTLLEQLLDGHSDVKGVGELYDFTSQMRYATDHHCRGVIDATIVERAGDVDFEAVGDGYLRGMQWRLGQERYFTDKLPSNFLNTGFICRALPQARLLHMVRDPVETCFSNLRELFSDANPYAYDQLELADYYRQYKRLMAHWHRAWPGRILDVDYAELTRDPETTMRRVAEFCGLAFEPHMLNMQARVRGVATASAVQVRQGITTRERPKWAPYAEYLQPLIRAPDDGFP